MKIFPNESMSVHNIEIMKKNFIIKKIKMKIKNIEAKQNSVHMTEHTYIFPIVFALFLIKTHISKKKKT